MAIDFYEIVSHGGIMGRYPLAVRKICGYISVYLHEPVSLGELAEETGLSTKTVSKKFREAMGISPVDYIHRQKMREAAHLRNIRIMKSLIFTG